MRIKVDTDALLETARRYERLSLELGDMGDEINESLNSLTSAMPGEDYVLEQIGSLVRKNNILKDELDATRVKLRYAARRYEEADRQMRRMSHEYVQNFKSGRQKG